MYIILFGGMGLLDAFFRSIMSYQRMMMDLFPTLQLQFMYIITTLTKSAGEPPPNPLPRARRMRRPLTAAALGVPEDVPATWLEQDRWWDPV